MHVKNESKKSLVRNKITQIRIGPIVSVKEELSLRSCLSLSVQLHDFLDFKKERGKFSANFTNKHVIPG